MQQQSDFSTCKKLDKCCNERQGRLTRQDFTLEEDKKRPRLFCDECYERSGNLRRLMFNSKKPEFGSMTLVEIYQSRWDVRLAQKFLLGRF